jgi:uncharacterized protein
MTRYNGPIIDVDVHHGWRTPADLANYLPREWRNLLELPGDALAPIDAAKGTFPNAYGHNKRLDAYPPGGSPPGSDYETLRRQLLDAQGITHAILSFDVGTNTGVANPYLATAIARAANDWNLDNWLNGRDERLYGGILVPTQDPLSAAAEIRRLAGNPRLREVLVVANGLGKPFGHPAYHPIYEAAHEAGLPIAIHNGGDNWIGTTHQAAGGVPGSRLEWHTLAPQSTIHHLVSFITNGVFDKFPGLKLMIIEIGVAWLPWLMWSLDARYSDLRRENPRITRLPSEYLRERVRVTTQPLEMSPRRDQLIELLQSAEGIEDMLCFATDYPHWDTDDPLYVANHVPDGWLPKLFYANAADFFGFPAPAEIMPFAQVLQP